MLIHLIRRRSNYPSQFSNCSYSILSPLSSFAASDTDTEADAADDPSFSLIPKPQNKKKSKQLKKPNKTPNFPIKSDLPFDFRYSYSESDPSINPIGFREPPRFSPFGPGRLERKWTGTCAPVPRDVEEKEKWDKEKEQVLGEPLSEEEIAELVEKYRHNDCNRQINIGN